MPFIPESVPPSDRATATTRLRYEDVSQDGRVKLIGIANAYGLVWQELLSRHPAGGTLPRSGVLAILSRILIERGGVGGEDSGPIGVGRPISVETAYQLAHSVDDSGSVNRLYLNTWVDLSGPVSRTHGPPPEGAGRIVPIGRAAFENVFTRLFAPPAERRVLRFDLEGLPEVPPVRYQPAPPESMVALPEGATPLSGDDALSADECPIALGLVHTDSNQHVNSLVYPHLFEEAALRRFARLGKSTQLLAERIEIAYRKPSFAGERLRILLRTFEMNGRLGAVGVFVADGDGPTARPRCYLRISFTA